MKTMVHTIAVCLLLAGCNKVTGKGDFAIRDLEAPGWQISTVEPMKVEIVFVPKSMIFWVCASFDAYACAFPYSGECKVYLPAGEQIKFEPHLALAKWVDRYMAEAVAHEILHCLHPNWHAPFDKAENAEVLGQRATVYNKGKY